MWTDEQKKAIYESGTNIIVSAGAGSGKTAVLTERVIQKLKSGVHIEELLILTFTKAAANEMKERIRESIKREPSLHKELLMIDQAYITTFDSFSLSVLKRYHYLLDLPKDINIAMESIMLINKRKCLDQVIDSMYLKDDKLFQEMIRSFCVKDDESIRKSIFDISMKLELNLDVLEYLDHYIEDYYREEVFLGFVEEYDRLVIDKKSEIKELENDFFVYVSGEYYAKVQDYLNNIYLEKDYVSLNSKLSVRFPSLPRGSDEVLKEVKERLVKALGELKDIVSYGSLDDMRKFFYSTKDVSSVIVKILSEYFIKINDFKRANNSFSFNDIACMAIKILRDNKDVCEEIKLGFKEILVDEYQDTNDLQEMFISLISNNNVYMVGDVKQSIYRFRNANPSIFRDKYELYSKGNDGIKIDLVKNFRSRSEVLDDVNIIFRQIMDERLGGDSYKDHQMVFGNKAYLEEACIEHACSSDVLLYSNDKAKGFSDASLEAFMILLDIKEKVESHYKVYDKKLGLRDIRYSDIVILMDRSNDFTLFKKIFEYANVPLTLYKDEDLENADDLFIIKNIIDFVFCIKNRDYKEKFRYSFVSVARSFLFNISDEDIFDTVNNNNIFQSEVYNKLECLVPSLNRENIYHFLVQLLDVTNYYENCICAGDFRDRSLRTDKILELGRNMDLSGYDIYQFREYLTDLLDGGYSIKYPVNFSNHNSVKVMSIHKSKGLEFPICYFSLLYKSFNIMDIKDKFLYDRDYGLVVPIFDEGIYEGFIKLIMKEKFLEMEIAEKIRLFYVAVTRAREKMIFLMPENTLLEGMEDVVSFSRKKKFRSFKDIMYSIKGDILKRYKNVSVPYELMSKDYMFPKKINSVLLEEDELLRVSECTIEECEEEVNSHFSKSIDVLLDKKSVNNINMGIYVHQVLQYIDFKNPDYEKIDSEFVRDVVRNFLQSDLLKDVENVQIFREYEFKFSQDDINYHGVIDLMIVHDDYIDIVDYKLKNVRESDYVKQLSGYKKYIENISGKDVNVFLYSLLDFKLKNIEEEVVGIL